MRVLFLTDLHIKPESTSQSLLWVNHLCKFLRSNFAGETLMFFLGDIIDKGSLNKHQAFEAADHIFTFIENELSSINYQMFFLPGNHDYCDENIDDFTYFSKTHQSKRVDCFNFSENKSWNYSTKDVNFILTDSVQSGKYNLPGMLDLESIQGCLLSEKQNILLLHHSLVFEDSSNHTGINNQPQSFEFLKEHSIKHVFHGHAHATRCISLDKNLNQYGSGSIGLEKEDLKDIVNEQEQFLEIKINGMYVEIVKNWIYRGGTESFISSQLYPRLEISYGDRNSVSITSYEKPNDYIDRSVLSRELASEDDLTRAFNIDMKLPLFEACQAHKHVLLIADAGIGKSIEMQNLAYIVSNNNPYLLPILLPLNIYNGETIQDFINEIVPQYNTLNPEQFLLVMDGYDEIDNVRAFKRALKQYTIKNPQTHICISLRSNFLVTTSDVFSDFDVYQLLELDQEDISKEIRKNGINQSDFFAECQIKGLTHFLGNPFYLNELIKIYTPTNELPIPSKLVDHLVNNRIINDSVKYECTYPSPLEECKHELVIALTRFSYGMQLLNTSIFKEETFQAIIKEKDRVLLKFSSLKIKTQNGHKFSHNIFKEYFVANLISKTETDSIIKQITIPETNFLNHNWFNILGFIIQLSP